MKSIGIRKETKSKWEKRTPLVPDDAKELIKKGINVFVEPSEIRIFKDEEYRKIGAIVQKRLDTDFIFGVKEIPSDFFEEGKTYIFFSHTIKGQRYNMPMLKKMMKLRNILIDYERILDEKGRRLIAFGKFAGIAGMIDTLWALGRRLEYEGEKTPFLSIKRAYEYHNVKELEGEAGKIGEDIKRKGFSENVSPLIFGILGYGNVSMGAQEVIKLFPHVEIKPEEIMNRDKKNNVIYISIFKEEGLVERKDGGKFDLDEYYDKPHLYKSKFERYIPFLSGIVNGIYWDKRYPRFITKEYFKKIYEEGKPKIKVIGDISCDIRGAVEFTEFANEPDKPTYVYEPLKDNFKDGIEGEGPVIVSIDILPSELPRDSSVYFSGILKKFIPEIVEADYPDDFRNCLLPEYLKKAVILYKGELTEEYKYIKNYL